MLMGDPVWHECHIALQFHIAHLKGLAERFNSTYWMEQHDKAVEAIRALEAMPFK